MKFNANFKNDIINLIKANPKEEEWVDLIRESSMYSFLKNDKDLKNNLNKLHKDSPLLITLLKSIFLPNDNNNTKLLMHDFGEYVDQKYPNMPLLAQIGKWRFGNNKNIKSIVSWYYQTIYNPESLICEECSGILIASFVKAGRFCCKNDDCSLFAIPIYENHCWQCLDDVSSINCSECGNCEWVICNKCKACKDPRFGGGCNNQFEQSSKIKRPIIDYNMIEDGDHSDYFKSELLNYIYKSSLSNYRFIVSSNLSKHNCNRGKKIIDDEQELHNYLAMYMPMHIAKLFRMFDNVSSKLFTYSSFNIWDWGCGQGLATLAFLEYAQINSYNLNVNKITLIEPSRLAINNAETFIKDSEVYKSKIFRINLLIKDLNSVENDNILMEECPEIHFFSNILDVDGIDLNHIKNLLDKNDNEKIICVVSPNYYTARKNIDEFFELFENTKTNLYSNNDDLKIYCRDMIHKKDRNRRATNYTNVYQLN